MSDMADLRKCSKRELIEIVNKYSRENEELERTLKMYRITARARNEREQAAVSMSRGAGARVLGMMGLYNETMKVKRIILSFVGLLRDKFRRQPKQLRRVGASRYNSDHIDAAVAYLTRGVTVDGDGNMHSGERK